MMLVVATSGLLLLAACGSGSKVSSSSSSGSSSSVISTSYGTPSAASHADRTVPVHILSSLQYDPATIAVGAGETVLFKVSNDTTGIHEFVLGGTDAQNGYQNMMSGMGSAPMLMGDQPNSVDVQPGQTKQLAWTFPTAVGATVIYGSHEPGDYAHGLKGLITVVAHVPATTSTTMNMTTPTTGGSSSTTPATTAPSTTMGTMPGMG
jgi:uncharacterized cupredoxin-like copper-binding protein